MKTFTECNKKGFSKSELAILNEAYEMFIRLERIDTSLPDLTKLVCERIVNAWIDQVPQMKNPAEFLYGRALFI